MVCPYKNSNGQLIEHKDDITCTDDASASYVILHGQCDGENSCQVAAANTNFGDTCPGTYKYLEVDFECQGEIIGS